MVEAAAQTTVPEERTAKLRVLRDEAEGIVGTIDTYLADSELVREAELMTGDARLVTARTHASIRDELVRRGSKTEAELDEAMILSHEQLDALSEEGLLEAALAELYPLVEMGVGKFTASLHPHDREGKFKETFGHVFGSQSQPRVKGRVGTVTHPTPRGPKVPKQAKPISKPGQPGELDEPKPDAPKAKLKVPEPVTRPVGTSPENQAKAAALGERAARRIRMAASGRRLASAEAHFNPAGSVSQHTLLSYVRDAASKPDTFSQFARVGEGGETIWHPARRQLHEMIIDAMMREPRIDENGDLHMDPDGAYLVPDPDGQPKMLASGGGYAAGKGGSIKLARKEGRVPEGAITLDPDRIKAMLPEYQDALDADDPEGNLHTYREAWEIAQEVQRRAQEKKLNVIVDGVSDTSVDEIWDRSQEFLDKGYTAHLLYTDIPTEEALSRAAGRAAGAKADADRRHIPEVIMRAVHRDVAATIPALLQRVASSGSDAKVPTVEVYDNDQGFDLHPTELDKKGQPKKMFRPPKRFAQWNPEDGMVVEDDELWRRLQAKGQERIKGVDDSELLPPEAAV